MEQFIGDMYLAAALLAYGADLLRIDKSDKRHQKFVFTEGSVRSVWTDAGITHMKVSSPSIKDVETFYVAKKLVFPPSYPDTIRSIKSAIHSG